MFARIFLAMALLFAITGCTSSDTAVIDGSSNVINKDREVESFSKINLKGIGVLVLKQGDAEKITVETDDNLQKYIKTEVKGDTLEISVKDENGRDVKIDPSKKIYYYITVNKLDSLTLSGAGKVQSDNQLKQREFDLKLSGAGEIDLNFRGNKLKVDVNGSGLVAIKGHVDYLAVDLSGAGAFSGFDLISQKTDVKVSGAGNVEVHASKKLDVKISGMGSVTYKGKPEITEKVTGMGILKSAGA